MGELAYKVVLYLLVGAIALALYWSCKKKQETKRLQKQAVELLQDMDAKKLRQLLGNVRAPCPLLAALVAHVEALIAHVLIMQG